MLNALNAVNDSSTSVSALGRLLTIKDVASALQMTPCGLKGLVRRGVFPAGMKIGRARRWDAAEIKAWLDSRKGESA